MTETANNGIPFVPENTLDPAAGLNLSLTTIDALLQLSVIDLLLDTPPGTPTKGDRYIIGTAPSGDWVGHDNQLARWDGFVWQFFDVFIALNLTDGALYKFSSGAWSDVTSAAGLSSGDNVSLLINDAGYITSLSGIADDLELKRYNETVATGSATLDRADGGIQTFTMTANITLAVTIAAGESLTFHLSAGDTYAVIWPTMTWVGGSVPTLTAADVIEFWKVGSTLYGAYVGAV